MRSNSVLEIDLDIIKQNYLKLKELTNAEVGASVKADAYGLGATHVVGALKELGCANFFLASIKEALELRNLFSNVKLFVFNGFTSSETSLFLDQDIVPVISSLYQVELMNETCKKRDKKIDIAIHVETGLHRLSMPHEEYELLASNPGLHSHLKIKYVISHLSSSDDIESPHNEEQLEAFQSIIKLFPGATYSLANTGGVLLGERYHFDMIRVGAGLYGINPRKDMSFFRNPIRLFCPLLQIKKLAKGKSLGYNQSYIANEDIWVGTIPIGYADGIFRTLGNKGSCYIMGFKVPIIGKVSMDLLNIDLSSVPEKYRFIGQEVDIICESQTPDDIAEMAGTIGYEIITSLRHRYERIYKGNDNKHNEK